MGVTLEDILAKAKNGSTVNMTIASNEEDGIASYAAGGLVFTPQTGGELVDGPPLKPAHMRTAPGTPMKYHFSDRRRDIDAQAGPFGRTPRQPFDADATEPLTVSVTRMSGPKPAVTLSFFGGTATLEMERQGKLLVGRGPALGQSEGGVYVISFTGISDPVR